MAQATAVVRAEETRINLFIAKVYLLMFVGLAVTGVVSYLISENLAFQYRLLYNPWLGWGILILQVIVVVALSARVMSMAPGAALVLFLLYAALTGVMLSTIFILYSDDQIYSVFIITSITFLLAGLVGLLVKKDMSGAGHFLFMLLLGWTLAWMASWFFSWFFGPLTTANWALNYIGIAIFVGLTAWDTQQLKKIGQRVGDSPAAGGLVIIGALKLYLDYINLFLLILRASNR